MSVVDAFFDTSVLLYLLSSDAAKSDRVETLLADRGTISVQVLNEFAAVCNVVPLTETQDRALAIVAR